jgi:hypothetical protein
MHGPINVKSPNNTSKWQMGFNLAFKGLILTCWLYSSILPEVVLNVVANDVRNVCYKLQSNCEDCCKRQNVHYFLFYEFTRRCAKPSNRHLVFVIKKQSFSEVRIEILNII